MVGSIICGVDESESAQGAARVARGPLADRVARTRPAQNTHVRTQPANARQKARRATSSPPTWRRWQSDDSAR